MFHSSCVERLFLSTPSARRATPCRLSGRRRRSISIHALREEGDTGKGVTHGRLKNFYPRPPRGGRLLIGGNIMEAMLFLSTPSARRATITSCSSTARAAFLSTPSARRATRSAGRVRRSRSISIHALREEGDYVRRAYYFYKEIFLSTPSARRATTRARQLLRERTISIHALREEGDTTAQEVLQCANYFYPRPPRGGRRYAPAGLGLGCLFLSTPSARRATRKNCAERRR